MKMKKAKTKRQKEKSMPLGWHKTDSQSNRRRAALRSRNGDFLQTARSLQQIANRHPDYETRRKARTDAQHFFNRYKLQKRNGGGFK